MSTHRLIRSPLAWLLGGAAILLTSSIVSQPRAAGATAPMERVRTLEARVAYLELRMLGMEQTLEDTQRLAGGSAPTIRRHEACDPSYTYDGDGSKLLLLGCEAHATGPCDPPLVVDTAGNKTGRPGCPAPPSRPRRGPADRLGF